MVRKTLLLAAVLLLPAALSAQSKRRFDARIEMPGGVPTITFPSADAFSYEVQHSSAGDLVFDAALTTLDGTGGDLSVPHPGPLPSRDFYRVALATSFDEVVWMAAEGGMRVLRSVLDTDPAGSNGMPRNEATEAELDSALVSSAFFVPAQLGTWMVAACLSHAVRAIDATFTVGFTTAELEVQLQANIAAIADILANHAFVDSGNTGKKAFYQVHTVPGGDAPLVSPFDRTISMLDNMWLILGLHVTSAYVKATPALDSGLATQLDALLAEFSLLIWYSDFLKTFYFGAADNPANPKSGPVVDRLLSEGRLAPVIARARGEITAAQFRESVIRLIEQSLPAILDNGSRVQWIPYAGGALETWSPTPYLSIERGKLMDLAALTPLLGAHVAQARRRGLDAAGATPIATGTGSFAGFGLSPCEVAPEVLDAPVIVLPAAGMAAGALGSPLALENFARAVHTAALNGEFHPVWGVRNGFNAKGNVFDESDKLRGTLEIGLMEVALLSFLLGGGFLDALLQSDAGWVQALAEYGARIDSIYRQGENCDATSGGSVKARGNAVWQATLFLSGPGASADYEIFVACEGTYEIILHYSNDNFGDLDEVTVLVDGIPAGTVALLDTGDWGNGWNVFESSSAGFVLLTPGTHAITLRLDLDNGGVEIDQIELKLSGTM